MADREAPRLLKIKAQLLCGGEIAMGPGKADLLDAIARTGSISAAGRAIGMSYRRSWDLVNVMNRCWSERLVETVSGGGRDKGARLTPCGKAVLDAYRGLQAELETTVAKGNLKALKRLLRRTPVPPSR